MYVYYSLSAILEGAHQVLLAHIDTDGRLSTGHHYKTWEPIIPALFFIISLHTYHFANIATVQVQVRLCHLLTLTLATVLSETITSNTINITLHVHNTKHTINITLHAHNNTKNSFNITLHYMHTTQKHY